jgi:hexosaminidase
MPSGGVCVLDDMEGIIVDTLYKATGDYLKSILKNHTGKDLPLLSSTTTGSFIELKVIESDSMVNESYILDINKKSISILATDVSGLINGIQSFRQILPLKRIEINGKSGRFLLPTGLIYDYPYYSYRGVMLDVARHFFSKEEVMRFIDLISLYKINRLHLHLADDQGWRIEIQSWPKLTEIGGQTEVGGGEGGFYSQEDYKELVRYAEQRNIIIIPEIDMPGHTNAALASYPELNCDGIARKLYTGTRVGFSSLCTQKEIVYEFVDDVVREIAAITPGPYFHIGGDESHSTEHLDYVYFINRVRKIVTSYNKQVRRSIWNSYSLPVRHFLN